MDNKNKKVTFVNEAGKLRLRAIEEVYKGATHKDTAKKYGVDNSTIAEWIKMYEEGGADRMNAPLKPRVKHALDLTELRAHAARALSDKDAKRIGILIDLEESGGKLNETAAQHSMTPQGVAKIRREYLAGNFPSVE